MPRRDGIDVSRFQHPPYQAAPIDWRAVRDAGVWWVAYQALKGESVDPSFAYNRAECAKYAIAPDAPAGTPGFRYRLAYGYPTTPASSNQPTGMPWNEQAQLFVHTLATMLDGEGVMCDAETEGISEPLTLEWCETVEATTHRPCAVYTGGYVDGGAIWHNTRIFNGQRARVFAAYTSEDAARGHAAAIPWAAWQYSGSGSCPGVLGACDLDQVDDPHAFDMGCAIVPRDVGAPLFVMEPAGAWWPDDYVPATLIRYSSGLALYATSADVEYARQLGVPHEPLASEQQYRQLVLDGATTYPLP